MNSIAKSLLMISLLLVFGTSSLSAQSQSGRVQGTVTDATTGEVLIGANVTLKGTSMGAPTDILGKFFISSVPAGSYTLRVSYIGYRTKEKNIEVQGGATLEVSFQMAGEVIVGQEVIVTAQARGQQSAINQQLSSNTIKNVVSSDKIRELPDQSAAAALSRLPGVSLMNGDQIVIRGVQAKLNTVLINGIQLPSTDMNDRSTNLGFISSNMLSGIEVIKTLTPDMDANTIGGVVNLRLREAPSGYHADALVQGDYNRQDRTYDNYKGWLSVSNRFFDDKFGVFLQGNADRSDVGDQKASATYQGIHANNDDWHYGEMSRFDFSDQVNIYDNSGASLILDYTLPHGKIVLQNSYAHNLTNAIELLTQMTFSPNAVTYTADRNKFGKDLWMNAFQAEYNFGDLKTELTVSHSSATKYTRIRYGTPGDNFSFTNAGEDPFGRDSLGNVRVFNRGLLTPQDVYNVQILPTNVDSAFLSGWAMAREEAFTEHLYNAALDVSMPVSFSTDVSANFKVGGKFMRTARKNNVDVQFTGSSDPDLYDNVHDFVPGKYITKDNRISFYDLMNRSFESDRGKYFLNGDYSYKYALDRDLFDRFWTQSMTGWQGATHLAKSWKDDFHGAEMFTAGYAMGTFDIGSRLTILGGVRMEHYNMKYKANFDYVTHEVYGDAVLFDTLNTVDRSDDHFFPNAQIRYKFTDWMDLRVAYSKGISRADYRAIVPSTYFVPGGGASAGNTKLDPAVSTNYDLALSVYSNEVGLFTVSPFYKKIVDIFYSTDIYYKNLSHYNVSFPDSAFFVSRGAQAPGASQKITCYVNNPNPGYIKGVELDWQSNFWYLPRPLNSLVVNVNYTKSWSDMAYHQVINNAVRTYDSTLRRYIPDFVTTDSIYTARLLYQANDVLNVAMGIDYKDFSGRISLNMRGNVITSIASDARREGDQYTGNIYRWDFTIQQKLWITGLSVSLSGVNIFHNPIYTYQKFKKTGSDVATENLQGTLYSPSIFSLNIRYSM